jgi:hypothetical protein
LFQVTHYKNSAISIEAAGSELFVTSEACDVIEEIECGFGTGMIIKILKESQGLGYSLSKTEPLDLLSLE